MDVGTAREAVADGHAGLCVLTFAPGERVGGATELALTRVVPSDRKTEPRRWAPLYRLRSAHSRLWQAYLPSPGMLRLNSG